MLRWLGKLLFGSSEEGAPKYWYEWRRSPSEDPQCFFIEASSQDEADKEAQEHFRELQDTKQTMMKGYHSLGTRKPRYR